MSLKEQSGFGWDEARFMVTASDSVWDAFLQSHPQCRKVRGTPFPEIRKLEVIFGTNNATGSLAMSHLGPVDQVPPSANQMPASNDSDMEAVQTGPSRRQDRRTAANALENVVNKLVETWNQPTPTGPTVMDRAVDLYQDTIAPQLANMEELTAGFTVLESEVKCAILLRIKDPNVRLVWFKQQIHDYLHKSQTYSA